VARCDFGDGQIAVTEMSADVGHDLGGSAFVADCLISVGVAA